MTRSSGNRARGNRGRDNRPRGRPIAVAVVAVLLVLVGATAQAASTRTQANTPTSGAPNSGAPTAAASPAPLAMQTAPVQPVVVIPSTVTPPPATQTAYAPAAVGAANGPPIVLTKGALRALNFNEPVTRIIVTDGSIVDASVLSERQVRLNALKNGRTYVTVTTLGSGPATYAVQVVPDLSAVQALLARDPSLRGLRLTSDDDHIVVSGYLGSVQAHAHAIDVLHAYYGEQLIDMIQTGGGQMIAVEIKFAAVQADTLKELGFNFTSFGKGFSFATTGPSSVSGFNFTQAGLQLGTALPLADAFNLLLASPNSSLIGIVSALTQANLASTLAEPTLLVRSGDQASFLAGGEVPIPVPQSGSTGGAVVTIEYHQYGVQLHIAPTVLEDGRIAMTVAPEVSSIDTANALSIQGYSVPAFLKRSTTTTIELGDGQSFVLAGLMYSTANVDESKFPGLGDLPIIGNFFRYTKNTRERQELIIIATPHIVQPLAAGSLPPLPGQEFNRDYNPGPLDMLLNRKPADAAAAQYGLMR